MKPASILAYAIVALCSPSAGAACAPAPEPVRDIRANSYYSDAAGSIVDKALYEQYQRNIGPITAFHRKLVQMADAFVLNNDIDAGKCVLVWLSRWAKEGGLAGAAINERGFQADYIRKWSTAGAAMAYFKVRQLAEPDHRLVIDPWLKQLAHLSAAFFDSPKHKRNNHYYWVGLAVMATAAVTGDPALWEKARGVYDEALSHIADDGTLNAEMARASMALHYHNYALMPLAVMAELSQVRGENWYLRSNGRLILLAELLGENLSDPTWFVQRTGKEQKVPKEGNLSWTVWMQDQVRNREKVAALAAQGPFFSSQMGGNPVATRISVKSR